MEKPDPALPQPGPHAGEAELPRQLDQLRLRRLHLGLFILLGVGLLLDQMETSLTSVLTAVYTQPGSGISAGAFGTMVFLYYVIGSTGAPLFGLAADKAGRRGALLAAFA